MKRILRSIVVFVVSAISFSPLQAQDIAYGISWGAPNNHLFDVEMRFENPESGPVSVRIPAWRPGRYVIQNYSRNILRFAAADGDGTALNFRKTDKDTWRIDAAPGSQVVVTYQVYSRELDAGSSYLDDSEAYINPITLLMYIPGQELVPVTLAVSKPDSWRAATQLVLDQTRNVYRAENYHELVDGPLIISPTLEKHSFEFAGATFEVAIQGEVPFDRNRLLEDLRKIAEVQVDLMGVIPFDRYVFLYHFLDYPIGHGVEHKNSTSIALGPTTKPEFYSGLLSVSAHELFHAWNVERIRPEEIYYPDYSKEQYLTTMWIYEGITSYYAKVSLVRAGLISEETFLNQLAGSIKSYEASYARSFVSVAEASFDSWIKFSDAPPHSTYSFYTAGEVIGLLLDMEVRGRTRNRQSLDHVMQTLYQQYASRRQGVPENGLRSAIEAITSGTVQPFFDAHVYGTDPIPYDQYLFYAGYRLDVSQNPNHPAVVLGLQVADGDGDVLVTGVRPESAAFAAGLDIDDRLVALNGKRLTTESLRDELMRLRPGGTATVTFFRRGELRTATIALEGGGDPMYRFVRLPETTLLQNQTRRDWMNLAAG